MTNFTIRYKKSQRGALKPFPGTFCLAFSSHSKLSKPQFLCLRSNNVYYILVTVLLVEELDTSKFTQQTKKLKTKIKQNHQHNYTVNLRVFTGLIQKHHPGFTDNLSRGNIMPIYCDLLRKTNYKYRFIFTTLQ